MSNKAREEYQAYACTARTTTTRFTKHLILPRYGSWKFFMHTLTPTNQYLSDIDYLFYLFIYTTRLFILFIHLCAKGRFNTSKNQKHSNGKESNIWPTPINDYFRIHSAYIPWLIGVILGDGEIPQQTPKGFHPVGSRTMQTQGHWNAILFSSVWSVEILAGLFTFALQIYAWWDCLLFNYDDVLKRI